MRAPPRFGEVFDLFPLPRMQRTTKRDFPVLLRLGQGGLDGNRAEDPDRQSPPGFFDLVIRTGPPCEECPPACRAPFWRPTP